MRTGIIKLGMVVMALVIYATVGFVSADTLSQKDESVTYSWAAGEVEKAKTTNLLPDQFNMEYGTLISREDFTEMAVKLYEALSGKEGALQGDNYFSDTRNTKIRIANSLGLVQGMGDGTFMPKGTTTRQEISVILYRTLKAAKPEYDYSYSYDYAFSDDYEISRWAKEAVNYLYGIGVINGVGDNLFDPNGKTTKEEAIVLVKRTYDKVAAAKDDLVVSRSGTSRRQSVLRTKLSEQLAKEMGKPYKWGGTGPNSYDCSGLVQVVFGRIGISLPRVSRAQALVGTWIAKSDLEYGDLVFFAKDGKTVHHVGIYVGNGNFVHAPQTGDVVKKSTLMSGYYERTYYSARRVIN
jgi:cell wall-associated NlpC family hydrolase